MQHGDEQQVVGAAVSQQAAGGLREAGSTRSRASWSQFLFALFRSDRSSGIAIRETLSANDR
jgi:hypothetical protein